MSADMIYRLISSILAIAGSYDAVTFDRAIEHVEKTFRGPNREALIKIILALKELLGQPQYSTTLSESVPAPVLSEPASPGALNVERSREKLLDDSSPELNIRELLAILKDPEFLTTKSEMVEFIRKHFGTRVSIKPEHKESRDALIDRAITAFRKASPKDQKVIYQAARKSYLRSRRSSLTDWSDIISRSGGDR